MLSEIERILTGWVNDNDADGYGEAVVLDAQRTTPNVSFAQRREQEQKHYDLWGEAFEEVDNGAVPADPWSPLFGAVEAEPLPPSYERHNMHAVSAAAARLNKLRPPDTMEHVREPDARPLPDDHWLPMTVDRVTHTASNGAAGRLAKLKMKHNDGRGTTTVGRDLSDREYEGRTMPRAPDFATIKRSPGQAFDRLEKLKQVHDDGQGTATIGTFTRR